MKWFMYEGDTIEILYILYEGLVNTKDGIIVDVNILKLNPWQNMINIYAMYSRRISCVCKSTLNTVNFWTGS